MWSHAFLLPPPQTLPLLPQKEKNPFCLQVTIESTLLDMHESLIAATYWLSTFHFHSPGSADVPLMSGGRNVCLVDTQVAPREYVAYGKILCDIATPLDNRHLRRSVLVDEKCSSGKYYMSLIRLYCDSRDLNTYS
jgi:hypothetical protein